MERVEVDVPGQIDEVTLERMQRDREDFDDEIGTKAEVAPFAAEIRAYREAIAKTEGKRLLDVAREEMREALVAVHAPEAVEVAMKWMDENAPRLYTRPGSYCLVCRHPHRLWMACRRPVGSE